MNGSMSYKERNQGINLGEQLFEDYCKARGHTVMRLGFDEKNNQIPNYWNINPAVRNLPDYMVCTKTKTVLVQVKGTANIKKTDIDMIPFFLEWYSSKEVPLYYAFCFAEKEKPLFITPDRVIELYQQESDRQWNDGKIYRTLRFD